MADPTRNQVFDALFALLQTVTFPAMGSAGATTWVETSRRLKLWGDVDPGSQPAMFLVDHGEDFARDRGVPSKRYWLCHVFAYCRTNDLIGSELVNDMLDGIDHVLVSDDKSTNVLTLGNKVYNCWIEGTVIKDPGDLDDQALLIVPIKILVP